MKVLHQKHVIATDKPCSVRKNIRYYYPTFSSLRVANLLWSTRKILKFSSLHYNYSTALTCSVTTKFRFLSFMQLILQIWLLYAWLRKLQVQSKNVCVCVCLSDMSVIRADMTWNIPFVVIVVVFLNVFSCCNYSKNENNNANFA